MKALIIVPLFREHDSIPELFRELAQRPYACDVLIVNDNSWDGTEEAIKHQNVKGVSVIHRRRTGLASALIEGLRWGMERKYDLMGFYNLRWRMDDFKNLIKLADSWYDVAVGSAYSDNRLCIEGLSIAEIWSELIASLIVRKMTNLPVSAPLSGLLCLRRSALCDIPLEKCHSEGRAFYAELLYLIQNNRQKPQISEQPAVFQARNDRFQHSKHWQELAYVFRFVFGHLLGSLSRRLCSWTEAIFEAVSSLVFVVSCTIYDCIFRLFHRSIPDSDNSESSKKLPAP